MSRLVIPEERIIQRIIVIRGEKVMLDVHLAELYGVETRVLKPAVKRNLDRFPADFLYELSDKEVDEVVSQNVIPHRKYFGGAFPFAFTETGVAMLSSILKSGRAVEMNIAIIRTFIELRKIAVNYEDILKKLKQIENNYDGKFKELYQALDHLINLPTPTSRKIGFKINKRR